MNAVHSALIADDVQIRSQVIKDPGGRFVSVISESDAVTIAKNRNCLLADVYITALSADIWPCRYIRNFSSLSSTEQRHLAQSSVAVIGCGGLGGHVILMLARIGIGSMTVVDPDMFDETNLNRQVFAVSDTIGKHKSEAAVLAVESVNPAVNIIGFQSVLCDANAPDILNTVDVVVDALDNLPDRKMLRRLAQEHDLPLVHGALAGFEGQVMTIMPDDSGCEDLFDGAEEDQADRDLNAESILGVPAITPAFIASLQAMEVVKLLLKRGNPSSDRILYADIELGEFNYFNFKS